MATLEIRNLHVNVDAEGDPQRRRPHREAGRDPRDHGPQRLRQVDARLLDRRPPALHDHRRARVTLDGEDVLAMTVDERARAGLFLAMQYPVEVPGVSVSNFLRTAVTAVQGEAPKLRTWVKDLNAAFENLAIDPAFKERSVNEGFSGGEKKRFEVLQLELLKPKVAILDETDSGLDVDALQGRVRRRQPRPRERHHRHAAHHALHAHPALHPARLRPRLRRRPHRRGRRPGARRPARGRGLRQVGQGRRPGEGSRRGAA